MGVIFTINLPDEEVEELHGTSKKEATVQIHHWELQRKGRAMESELKCDEKSRIW